MGDFDPGLKNKKKIKGVTGLQGCRVTGALEKRGPRGAAGGLQVGCRWAAGGLQVGYGWVTGGLQGGCRGVAGLQGCRVAGALEKQGPQDVAGGCRWVTGSYRWVAGLQPKSCLLGFWLAKGCRVAGGLQVGCRGTGTRLQACKCSTRREALQRLQGGCRRLQEVTGLQPKSCHVCGSV